MKMRPNVGNRPKKNVVKDGTPPKKPVTVPGTVHAMGGGKKPAGKPQGKPAGMGAKASKAMGYSKGGMAKPCKAGASYKG